MLPLYEFLLAVALDMIIGDPAWLRKYHPKRLLLMLSNFLEGVLRQKLDFELKTAGALLTVLVALTAALAALLLSGLGWVARVLLMYLVLSTRLLSGQGLNVLRALRRHDLTLARERLGELLDWDTNRMTEEDVVRATAEHVSLNLGDGVVAPLAFMALGSIWNMGAVFGWVWLAVSVLDEKIGLRDERYIDFGRFCARLDDALNFIPARLAGLLAIVGAGVLGLDAPGAVRVMDAYHATQSSPNGGWAMAAFSGALGIRLGGDIRVGGVVLHRRGIGQDQRTPDCEDVARAVKLVWCAANGTVLLGALLLLIF